MCCSELWNVWISFSAIVICSYILQVFSKSNYHSEPWLQSLNHGTIWIIYTETKILSIKLGYLVRQSNWHSQNFIQVLKSMWSWFQKQESKTIYSFMQWFCPRSCCSLVPWWEAFRTGIWRTDGCLCVCMHALTYVYETELWFPMDCLITKRSTNNLGAIHVSSGMIALFKPTGCFISFYRKGILCVHKVKVKLSLCLIN
jgi:hypothetical protein